MKKYKITDESIMHNGIELFRIEAIKDFANVRKGDKGGFIANESNLSHDGNCWIYDDAKVYEEARIYENACIYNNTQVYGHAKVSGYACLYHNAKAFDYAFVRGDACLYNNSQVYHFAKVYNHAIICDYAKIYCCVIIHGNAIICGDALVGNTSDYIVFKNWWSSGRYFTWTRSNNLWKVGCFHGTGEKLIAKAYKDSELSGREYKRVVDYVESILNEKQ